MSNLGILAVFLLYGLSLNFTVPRLYFMPYVVVLRCTLRCRLVLSEHCDSVNARRTAARVVHEQHDWKQDSHI